EDSDAVCIRCADVDELLQRIEPPVGAILIAEEMLTAQLVERLAQRLMLQPPWSDLPVILIAAQESSLSELVQGLFPESGNVTVLQRPIHPVSLVSAVKMALRARARQLEVRDLLGQRELSLRNRDEFLAMLAHELRNPLAPIRNAAYILGTMESPDPDFVRTREMIDKQARHITRLVDDLLDVSRLELGKVQLRLQRVELNEAVAAAVDSGLASVGGRRHEVNVRLPRPGFAVRADPVRLEQVVCNLVVNATKFTPAGGNIDVEVSREGACAVIAVTDDGAGIRPEMLESIFDLFAQDSVTLARTKGGLGIGLTLVKRLAELHGGSVRASSEGIGRGSRFEVRLPIDSSVSEKAAKPRAMPQERPKRVLVIEDGSDTRDSLRMLLKTWNHEVVCAASGAEGLDRARESQPDVAIIDIGLPGLDGYEVASRIRGEGSEWSRTVRLIALTGYGQAGDRQRALDAGFDVHVLKPLDPAELRQLVASA
ncbi:MAG TPA: ATP-binding protein, partial [Usitatibacter sp.]|nr:ATP-binding protein [Usitatibacter sp.]